MAAISRASLLLAFNLLCLPWLGEAGALKTMPTSSLYDYAVIRADRLNRLAVDIYQKFLVTSIDIDGRTSDCLSASVPIPTTQQETLQKSNLELLRISLMLIQLWLKPVQSLSSAFGNNPLYSFLDNFIYKYLKDLEEVIQTLMGRLDDGSPQTVEIMMHTYNKADIYLPSEDPLIKNYKLLYCFRRDMRELAKFLHIVQCRSVESSCAYQMPGGIP
uniref:Growth hormone n=1 Tax=Saimiri boliviensis boliviensis TaxID=39432 RepID=A0A2K6TB07_SAIBB